MNSLAFDGVSMEFPGVKALENVSFAAQAGSVHALVGENGAGKSTLLKILAGALQPTAGTLRINEAPLAFHTTTDALQAGVAVIYQELHLVPEMSIAENVYLGNLPHRLGVVDREKLIAATKQQLERIGEKIDPGTKVARLPLAQRQMVEIAKALSRGARIIAFDEPTSSLSDREVRRLFTIIRELKAGGCAILYVSHRMEEIFELCDRVTVLRDGKRVETAELGSLSRQQVVRAMVGRELANVYGYASRRHRDAGLEVQGLLGPGLAEPCSFAAAAGEILGIFGLVGAGRTELLRLLFGVTKKSAGKITVAGEVVAITSPRDAIQAGVVLCPEDRKKEGIIPVRSVSENVNLSIRRARALSGIWIDDAWEDRNTQERIKQLRIRTPSAAQLVQNLSGGNQQKVVLGRWLSGTIKVLLLDEPTRGIDIGAKSEIYAIIQALARDGVCVIMVSSELPEVIGVCDRIAVMREGCIAAFVERHDASEQKLLELALPLEAERVA